MDSIKENIHSLTHAIFHILTRNSQKDGSCSALVGDTAGNHLAHQFPNVGIICWLKIRQKNTFYELNLLISLKLCRSPLSVFWMFWELAHCPSSFAFHFHLFAQILISFTQLWTFAPPSLNFFMYPEAKCPAALPRLVKPFLSPRAPRLRNTFQALFCCHTRRLLIQSGWGGVSLQIRPPVLKELLLHAAPYVRWDWLPCLSTQDIFFSPLSSLYLITPPSHLPYLLVPLLTIWITYLFFPPLSKCFSSRLSPTNAPSNSAVIEQWRYRDTLPLSFHLLPEQSLTSALYSDVQKTWERSAALGPPSAYYRPFFFCPSDCSARMREETDGSDERQKCKRH